MLNEYLESRPKFLYFVCTLILCWAGKLGDSGSKEGIKRYRWNSLISFTRASLSEHRGPRRKKEKLCQAVPQKANHRSRERTARWCWQCCNTGSGSLWNGLGAYIGNKTSSLHKSPACAISWSYLPSACASTAELYVGSPAGTLVTDFCPQSCVWEVGDVLRGWCAPQLPRHLSQELPAPQLRGLAPCRRRGPAWLAAAQGIDRPGRRFQHGLRAEAGPLPLSPSGGARHDRGGTRRPRSAAVRGQSRDTAGRGCVRRGRVSPRPRAV